MKRLLKWLLGLVGGLVLVALTVLLLRGFDARSRVELHPWHTVVPASEMKAADLDEKATLATILTREEVLFREVHDRVESRLDEADRYGANRYFAGGPLNPASLPKDWNRTFEMAPEGELRGGVLLVHGLTDAPYSMRRLAEIYSGLGYYALSLRMPGHGTVPSALTRTKWTDWAAAVRVGVRHVRSRAGDGKPLHLVGYSNGGALCVDYALNAVDPAGVPKGAGSLPRADRILLVSPMIGVTPFAGFARVIERLGSIPYFEASRWLDVLPEYVPFKYNSFPANAGAQTAALTAALRERIGRAESAGRLRELPPILTFVSLVDATVLTPATVRDLYDRLGENGSELVVFDVNRSAEVRPFLKPADEKLLGTLLPSRTRPWRLTVVTNAGPDTRSVVERVVPAGAAPDAAATERPLGLEWPTGIFSLSHVALPFAPDDPLFGGVPSKEEGYRIQLGTLGPRGERSVLTVSFDSLMRLTWNPFFSYVEERVKEWAR
jgi:alpha-beta hydrolase superfamily lysophospholipase